MPQLDIYLLTTFVWSILFFFTILYFINIIYVNLNLFFVLNLRYLKYFVDKLFMFSLLKDYNQNKSSKILNKLFLINIKNTSSLKQDILTKDFINMSAYTYNLYYSFNVNLKQINAFIKLNIESNRIG